MLLSGGIRMETEISLCKTHGLPSAPGGGKGCRACLRIISTVEQEDLIALYGNGICPYPGCTRKANKLDHAWRCDGPHHHEPYAKCPYCICGYLCHGHIVKLAHAVCKNTVYKDKFFVDWIHRRPLHWVSKLSNPPAD